MLTQGRANELLRYDRETGKLHWRVGRSNAKAGSEAGWKERYVKISLCGARYYVHRLIVFMETGCWPDEVDHVNGNGLDNRWRNLRAASRRINMRNLRRSTANTSGVTGVYWSACRQKWYAQIGTSGKCKYLGIFDSFDDAATARRDAERKYGFHPNHGRARAA